MGSRSTGIQQPLDENLDGDPSKRMAPDSIES